MARFGTVNDVFLDNDGTPLAGGLLYFYESGTSTDKTTYSDSLETVPNTQPLELDAYGRLPDCFFTGQARVRVTTAAGVAVDDKDPIPGFSSPTAPSGTFQPGLEFGGGSTGIVYGANIGNYFLSGNWCTATIWINLSNKGSSTGNARITGLPFNNSTNSDFAHGAALGMSLPAASVNSPFGMVSASGNEIILRKDSGLITNSDFANDTVVVITVSYPAVL